MADERASTVEAGNEGGSEAGNENGDGSGGDTGTTDRGTYTLVIELSRSATVDVGALGPVDLAAGWYAYTGSAFGPGGFARVDRHRELAAGERDARHWHVDYLLTHPDATVEGVVRPVGADVACAVGGRLVDGCRGDGRPGDGARRGVPGFGASDCDCASHLAYAPDRDSLIAAVERAHDRAAAVERANDRATGSDPDRPAADRDFSDR